MELYKTPYRLHKSPPLVHPRCQINPVQATTAGILHESGRNKYYNL